MANITGSNDAVVVGVEYRLGVAGFLALDALRARDSRGGCVGNYGLLDVFEALRWVHLNIARFGGDPDRVTVAGQSSGGSLVFALLASPEVTNSGYIHGGISLSGSPRLNSTTSEASSYWHREVVASTRCANLLDDRDALAACLLSLNETELVRATPANWHTDGFGFSVFSKTFQYAPILLIDHCMIPRSYFDAFSNGSDVKPLPLIIGATRQESDFSPEDDVRSFTSAQFRSFVRKTFTPAYSSAFVSELVQVYLDSPQIEPFDPQRLYSDIVTDATILCPNAYLAARWAHGDEAPVYFYSSRQRTENPFCVLEPFNHFTPPYCPLYSFHASDMFMWLSPQYDPVRFNYSMTAQDLEFGAQVQSRFAEFAQSGKVASWVPFADVGDFAPDRLPLQYHAVDMALPDTLVARYRKEKCNFWLKHKFYEKNGLIN